MKFTIPIKELKPRGYTFQKLYARDYKTYRKKIGNYTIWLWVLGKELEVNDWYQNTGKIIEFYKQHKSHPKFDEIGYDGSKKNYIKVQMNPENGHVQFYDYDEYYKVFDHPKNDIKNAWKSWEEKYGNWSNEILLNRGDMDLLLKEIEYLTK